MSDVVEKAIAALPHSLSSRLSYVSGVGVACEKDWGQSRSFQTFVKNINNIKTKHEEDAALERELTLQRQKLAQPSQNTAQKRESLVRIIYSHMLGKDVSFACIHAVKLAQQGSILDKKVGYLVCSLLMQRDDDLVMLLVNTMQKDLSSTNVLCNLAGLTAVVQLCSSEMVPAILPMVKDKLSHPKDAVRKKAVLAMHYFLMLAPEMVQHELPMLQRMLSDKDPSVVWATLHVFSQLIPMDPSGYQSLVPGLVSFLGQVIGRNLPTDYDHHTVPAPWITILLLRMLGKLGAQDECTSQQIYPALKDVLQRTEPSHKMGLAVIFECLHTITHIYPYPQLVEHAVSCVGKFLSAKNINLKYLGLKALVSLVTISPYCTVEHQDIVLDCLEHPDPTIQRMSLELVYKMANETNVEVISSKMLSFLHLTFDKVIKGDIVHKVIDLTQRFSSNLLWYLQTMNQVICVAEAFLPCDTVQATLWRISQGCASVGDESDPLSDKQLRSAVFQLYWQLLQGTNVPDTLLQIAVWVLGEYTHCVQGLGPRQVILILLQWYTRSRGDRTRCLVVTALHKLAYYITSPDTVIQVLRKPNTSVEGVYSYQLTQSIQELEMLCKSKQEMKIAANPETRIITKEMDFSLSFLDEYVCESVENGGSPYKPRMLREVSVLPAVASQSVTSLQFGPYEAPLMPSKSSLSSMGLEGGSMALSASSASTGSTEPREPGLRVRGRKVWGKTGMIQEELTHTPLSDPLNRSIPHNIPRDTDRSVPDEEHAETEREFTPGQLKRRELAQAIFGDARPQRPTHLLNERLVTLATEDSSPPLGGTGHTDLASQSHTLPGSPLPDPGSPLGLLSDPESPLGPLPDPESPLGSLPDPDMVSSPPYPDLATPDSKRSLAQLLDYDSIKSPLDQVLDESLYHSFRVDEATSRSMIISSNQLAISPAISSNNVLKKKKVPTATLR